MNIEAPMAEEDVIGYLCMVIYKDKVNLECMSAKISNLNDPQLIAGIITIIRENGLWEYFLEILAVKMAIDAKISEDSTKH